MRAAFVALTLFAAGPALAAPPVIAVFDFEANRARLPKAFLEQLAGYAATELAGSGQYKVSPRSELQAALRKKTAESYAECYDASCQIEIGKELAAEKTLAGSIAKLGSKCVVTLKVFDLRTSAAERAGSGKGGCSEDDVLASLEAALAAMLKIDRVSEPLPPPILSDAAKAERAWQEAQSVALAASVPKAERAATLIRFLAAHPKAPRTDEATRWRDQLLRGEEPTVEAGMVLVPRDVYNLGCQALTDPTCDEAEAPPHTVRLPAFAIDVREVTVSDYERCVKAGACTAEGVRIARWDREAQPTYSKLCNYGTDRARHPMNCVDYAMATAYCAWAKKRLPTEDEWEAAARGSDARRYPWGDDNPKGRANVADLSAAALELPDATDYDDGFPATAPVGSFPRGASAVGAHDMAGNVWEWTTGEYAGGLRTVRGGAFSDGPKLMRTSARFGTEPDARRPSVGLRCAR